MAVVITRRGVSMVRNAVDLRTAQAWGFLPGVNAELGLIGESLAYFWTESIVVFTGSVLTDARPGSQGSQPVAVPVWNKDSGGVPFPAGSVLALAGVHPSPFLNNIQLQNGVDVLDGFLAGSLRVRSHRGRYLFIVGALPGTSATIVVRRYGYWQEKAVGSPTVLETITVNGNDGAVQIVELDDIEVPDDAANTHGIYYETTWTGTPAHRVWLAREPSTTNGGMVVPTAIPVGFTASDDDGETRSYGIGRQSAKVRDSISRYDLGGLGTLNHPLLRDMTSEGWRNAYNPTDLREPRRMLAMPDTVRSFEFSFSTSLVTHLYPVVAPPRIFVGGALREMTYWPVAIGPYCPSGAAGGSGSGRDETRTDVGSWTMLGNVPSQTIISKGPGWRNLRVYGARIVTTGGATVDNITLEWRIDGGAPSSMDITSLSNDGVIAAFADITTGLLPAVAKMDAVFEYRTTITATFGVDSGSYQAFGLIYLSPRVDIPCPWRMPGRGVDTAPGAYLTGSLVDPQELGGVLHVDPGTTSVAWTVAAGITSEIQCRVISFVPPSIGYWRVKPPGSFNATLGEYQDRYGGVTGDIGRPSKRFYGRVISNNLSTINGTWELEAIAPTYHAIAAAGTTVTSSMLSPITSGMFFGTIALPAAGTYRIRTRVASFGVSFRILLSLTDAFCSEPALDAQSIEAPTLNPINGSSNFLTATAPPGSPTTGMTRLIVAPATGEWAGREGQAAFRLDNRWVYLDLATQPPQVAVVDGVWSISDGATWSPLASTDLTVQTVTVDAAATLYVRIVNADDERMGTTPSQGILSPGSPTVYWEAI